MWERGDFILNLLVNPWQLFILNVGPWWCWTQLMETGLLFHWSVWTPPPSHCAIPHPLNPPLLNQLCASRSSKGISGSFPQFLLSALPKSQHSSGAQHAQWRLLADWIYCLILPLGNIKFLWQGWISNICWSHGWWSWDPSPFSCHSLSGFFGFIPPSSQLLEPVPEHPVVLFASPFGWAITHLVILSWGKGGDFSRESWKCLDVVLGR